MTQSIVSDEPISIDWIHYGSADFAGLGPLTALLAVPMGNNISGGIAERKVQPLRDVVRDVDFGAEYSAGLESTLRHVRWLKLERFEEVNATTSVLPHTAVLQIATSQRLSQAGDALCILSELKFFATGRADEASAQVWVYYQSEQVAGRDWNAIAAWAEKEGKAYRQALAEGISESMKMTNMALEHMGGTRYGGSRELFRLGPAEINGTVIEERPDRVIYEIDGRAGHEFVSIPKNAILARFAAGSTSGATWRSPAVGVPARAGAGSTQSPSAAPLPAAAPTRVLEPELAPEQPSTEPVPLPSAPPAAE